MDVLFLCGVFAKENEAEVIAQAKKSVEFSANQMQLKLISGLKEVADTQVISASKPQSAFFRFHKPSAYMPVCFV